MNILITGAFGTVGRQVIRQAHARGHRISALEIDSKKNRRIASRMKPLITSLFFGDIRNVAAVEKAAENCSAVIHLAAILPPASEANPELCRSVNIGGTANLISAMKKAGPDSAFILVSSASVMGPTQDREPPRTTDEPAAPNDEYARSKVEAEAAVLASGLRACVLRLAAVMPTSGSYSIDMAAAAFDLPLEARCEAITDIDVATACIRAAEILADEPVATTSRKRPSSAQDVRGRAFFIAGGKSGGWQMRVREMYENVFAQSGLAMPDESLFTTDPDRFAIDWYDTDEAQMHFEFQNNSLEDFKRIAWRNYRLVRPLITLARPLIIRYLESKSPYRSAS